MLPCVCHKSSAHHEHPSKVDQSPRHIQPALRLALQRATSCWALQRMPERPAAAQDYMQRLKIMPPLQFLKGSGC